MARTTWADERMEALEAKGRADWDQDDWDSYTYIQQTRFECGYYDD